MTLSQTAEYALRAVLYLARQAPARVSADEIARVLGAPANYMSKTLNQLAKTGIVDGARGPMGGFRLVVSADELTVAQVASPFAAPRANPVCLLGDRLCSSRKPCEAHHRWTVVMQAAAAPLAQTTIADLLSGS